MRTIHL